MAACRRLPRRADRGVSLPELLVVIAILALGVMVSVPLVARRVHDAKMRSAVSQFAVSLRAARMIAVSKGEPVTVTVSPEPANAYEYVDVGGLTRRAELPAGVSFDPASSGSITFRSDGSLSDPATVVLEASLSDGVVESWTVDVPVSGIPRMVH